MNWRDIAKVLGQNDEVIQRQSAKLLLLDALAALDEREAVLMARYKVSSANELRQLIEARNAPEHPSWEDLIQWEAIDDFRLKLKHLLATLV